MDKKIIRLIIPLLIALTLAACGSGGGGISITDPWARPALADGNGAAYMVLENTSGIDDVLLSASTDAASVVELHDVIMMSDSSDAEGSNSMMKMVKQETVPIADGQTVTFEPGSLHVMLIGLTADLNEGDTISLTLVFQNAGEISIEVPVEQR